LWRRRDSIEEWHQDAQMWSRKTVERSGTSMRRCGGGKEVVERSGTGMRGFGGGKEIVARSGVGLLSQRSGRETHYRSYVVRYNCELQIHTLNL
jgi:hypothetical protein